jgi:hypothetical protein
MEACVLTTLKLSVIQQKYANKVAVLARAVRRHAEKLLKL